MSKIVVECKVPAAGLVEDVSIPYEKPLAHTLELLKALFSHEDSFSPDETTLLCDSATGNVYNLEKTPEDLGLLNGSSFMLL